MFFRRITVDQFFITIIFLAFCITIIVLNSKREDIAALGIKTLGKLSKLASLKSSREATTEKTPE